MLIQKGDDDVAVTLIQKSLNQLGVKKLVEDGKFGPATYDAVVLFQMAHNLPRTGDVDDATREALAKALAAQMNSEPMPWLQWMWSHIGEVEQTGGKATDFDNEVFSHTSYGNLDGVMEAGCAATACAALEESGYKSSHNAAAESFRHVGTECELKPGCIVGFNWKGQKGVHCDHVTFCDHIIDENTVACLGGNQGHQVKVSIFSRKFIDFTRWPDIAVTPQSGVDQAQT